jgi:NADH-quinone oxidoreductase subunit K
MNTLMDVTPNMVLVLASLIFCVGMAGVIIRKNLLIMLMGIELMLNSVNLCFVTFSKVHQVIDGEIISIFIMAVAAAESAIGLGLLIALFRTLKSVSTDSIEILRD